MDIEALNKRKKELQGELKEIEDQLSNIDGMWLGHTIAEVGYRKRLITVKNCKLAYAVDITTGHVHKPYGAVLELDDYTLVTKLKDSDFGL